MKYSMVSLKLKHHSSFLEELNMLKEGLGIVECEMVVN